MFFYSLQLALGADLGDTLSRQWNVPDPFKWRDSETFDNHGRDILNGVSLHCNPVTIDNGFKSILLYTDIETQVTLASYKHAYWYDPIHIGDDLTGHVGEILIGMYNNIKDPTWPEVAVYSDFFKLDQNIHDELSKYDFPIKHLESPKDIKTNFLIGMGREFRGVVVDPTILEFELYKTDHVFFLQDVIRTKFKCVCDELNLSWTQEVRDHVTRWVNLHPDYIKKLLIK